MLDYILSIIQQFGGSANVEPIISYVVNKAGQIAQKENRNMLGFIDLFNALVQIR